MKNSTLHLLKEFNGVNIRFMDGEKVNLTELWKASGSDYNQRPPHWLEQDSTQDFIKTVVKKLNVLLTDILETQRGRGGGTWAHKQIVLTRFKQSPAFFVLW